MATPRELFEKDSSKGICMRTTHSYPISSTTTIPVEVVMEFEYESGARYGSIYIDDTPAAIPIILKYITDPDFIFWVPEPLNAVYEMPGTDEVISSADLVFTRRVRAYTAYTMSPEEKQFLKEKASENGVMLLLRDAHYLSHRQSLEKPMAFISHDSRDKEPLVRELAATLQKMQCTVWYDEFSLIPGQSLRGSIEAGLKACHRCVLVLSPNFLGKGGWPKAEFDSIFTRELLEDRNLIIPIWHGVTREEVYNYSPRLLDKVAINSKIGVDEIAKKVLLAVNTVI